MLNNLWNIKIKKEYLKKKYSLYRDVIIWTVLLNAIPATKSVLPNIPKNFLTQFCTLVNLFPAIEPLISILNSTTYLSS